MGDPLLSVVFKMEFPATMPNNIESHWPDSLPYPRTATIDDLILFNDRGQCIRTIQNTLYSRELLFAEYHSALQRKGWEKVSDYTSELEAMEYYYNRMI